MVEEKVLIKGTRCRLTETGMKHWFGYHPKNVKKDLEKTIFIATGDKNIHNKPFFNICYPTGSSPIKDNWGTSMWLNFGEFEIIESRKLEEWL